MNEQTPKEKKPTFMQQLRRLWQQNGRPDDKQFYQIELLKKLYLKNGLILECTCMACPEQYEVFKNGEQVAYYRLRHGSFRVDYLDCGGETIFEADPNGDGEFEPNERFNYMKDAMKIILNKINTI
jgi:hypothetical protein